MRTIRPRSIVAVLLAALAVGALAARASARMKSTKLSPGVCLTSGGGRFVDIPGFPGEMIDKRLLRDIRWLRRHYPIFITDGYSTSPIHSANGEHPLGLALDIVPDTAAGGTWADIDALASFAEPQQNAPTPPFRWVGYNGDSHHGRGHHLHLSWSHSPATFGKPAESVYTMRCPRPRRARREPPPPEPSGGTGADKPPPSLPGGGVSPRLAPIAPERAGVEQPHA
jgi:hypothetical protein